MSTITIHASCVAIGGRGVLIAGRSGAGKSDLSLRLIDRGAVLVSDDYTLVDSIDGALQAGPPETIAGKMEVRGVGLLETAHQPIATVALLIDLDLAAERLPVPATRDICGIAIPVIGLNGLEPSAPIKVEIALSRHGLAPPCPS